MSAEEWRRIPGFPDYEVSDQGRVRSNVGPAPVVLRPGSYANEYLFVNLGRGNMRRIHRLVMLAFVGPLPAGMQTRHLNDDRRDNRLINLTYGTASENMFDAVRNGRNKNANKTHCKRGHEFTPDNIWVTKPKPGRRCRTCQGYARAACRAGMSIDQYLAARAA